MEIESETDSRNETTLEVGMPSYLEETELIRRLVRADNEGLDVADINIATRNGDACEANKR